jgi:hypothetical protein
MPGATVGPLYSATTRRQPSMVRAGVRDLTYRAHRTLLSLLSQTTSAAVIALRLSPPRVNQPCWWAARACWAGQVALLARPQLGQTRIHIADSPTRYDCSHVPPYAARFDSLIQISGI